MTFFDHTGIEIDVEQFEPGSLLVARVTKRMSKEEFFEFCKSNRMLDSDFQKRGITLVFCPDWVEFKELRSWNENQKRT